jgi:hypothetical protein
MANYRAAKCPQDHSRKPDAHSNPLQIFCVHIVSPSKRAVVPPKMVLAARLDESDLPVSETPEDDLNVVSVLGRLF